MNGILDRSLASRRFSADLVGGFAGVALLLASIGIYGLLAYMVGQKSREIAIRMALGAQRRDVLRLVLSQGAKLVAVGLVIGIGGALALTQLMVNLLFGVTPWDPLTFAGVAIVFAMVALAACYMPARRAMRVDPMVALRYE